METVKGQLPTIDDNRGTKKPKPMITYIFQGLFRSLLRNKLLSTINIAGLALGFSGCILIVLFLFDELGYDQHHANIDRIYRVSTKFVSAGAVDNIAISASPLPVALKERFPEVEECIRLNLKGDGVTIQQGNRIQLEEDIYSADQGILQMFSYNFLEGNPKSALSHPTSLVLTKSLANKYFPNGGALGSTLKIENVERHVTGVIEDIPRNSEIYFSMLLPLDIVNNENWFDFSYYVFVMFHKNAINDPSLISRFQKKLDKLAADHINGPIQKNNPTLSASMALQPLKGLHFDNTLKYDTPKGKKEYVYVFMFTALLILFIACLNYINFSIIQSMEKSREVGIRKVVGSTFSQLVFRYISQSMALTLVALVLSIALVYLLLPYFNDVVHRSFKLDGLLQTEILTAVAAIVIVTGVLAGSYPAFYSASLHAVKALKGEVLAPAGKAIRKISITIQFVVTLGLLICTAVIYSQMSFIRNYSLGFRQDNVLVVSTPEDSLHYNNIVSFVNDLSLSTHFIESIAIAGDGGTPGDPQDEQRGSYTLKNEDGAEGVYMINNTFIDRSYLNTLGIDIKLGRNYNESPNDHENAIIINEALVKMLGWKDPLSQTIRWNEKERAVIGVVGNVHYKSLYNPVEPQFFVPHENQITNVFIRLKNPRAENIDEIHATWTKHLPGELFRYSFLDNTLARQYAEEDTITHVLSYFSVLTILISLLGTFGLALLSAYQRRREIGIRKVVGATFRDIALLFSKEYVLLLALALAVTSPIAWHLLNEWLNRFVTHVAIKVDLFVYVWLLFGCLVLLSILLSITKIVRQKNVDLMA